MKKEMRLPASRVRSADVTKCEKWLGYLLGSAGCIRLESQVDHRKLQGQKERAVSCGLFPKADFR